jgi:hypothetical protein
MEPKIALILIVLNLVLILQATEDNNAWSLVCMAASLNDARFNFITQENPPYHCTIEHFAKNVWKKEKLPDETQTDPLLSVLGGMIEPQTTITARDEQFGIEISYNKEGKATTCRHWEKFTNSDGKESALMYISSNEKKPVCEACKNVINLVE